MANDCAAINTFSKMLVQGGADPRTFGAGSERYDYVFETLATDRPLQGGNKITGTRSPYNLGVRKHSYIPSGLIYLQSGPTDWTAWLQRIFGGTLLVTDIPLAEALPDWDVLVDRENGVFRYSYMQVDQAIIRGATADGGEGLELIDMIVQAVGKSEDIDGESWPGDAPAITNTAANAPYIFSEGALTVDGTVYGFDSFNLMVNNQLMVRTRNNLTPNCIRSTGRTMQLQVKMPFLTTSLTDALDSWDASVTGSLVFTNGTMSTTFSFPALRNTFKSPTSRGKTEIPLDLNLTAYRTSAAEMVTITHDATP